LAKRRVVIIYYLGAEIFYPDHKERWGNPAFLSRPWSGRPCFTPALFSAPGARTKARRIDFKIHEVLSGGALVFHQLFLIVFLNVKQKTISLEKYLFYFIIRFTFVCKIDQQLSLNLW
jgi:hypothetical protein